jgi:ABC-2 type transport system permease protein
MSAIYILWLRELKRYTRSRAQIVASLGQPMLYLVVLGFGLGPVFQRAGNGSYLQFVAPGVIGMTVLFSSIFSGLGLLFDRQFGFLKETLVAPVPRIHIMIGRTLGGATVAVIQGLLVTLVCVLAGFRPVNFLSAPLAVGFMVLIAVVFAALGVAVGSSLQDMQGFQLIMNFLVMPIFFLVCPGHCWWSPVWTRSRMASMECVPCCWGGRYSIPSPTSRFWRWLARFCS